MLFQKNGKKQRYPVGKLKKKQPNISCLQLSFANYSRKSKRRGDVIQVNQT